jgi:hypothetical protein
MSLWCSQSGRRRNETGKFRTRARLGTVMTPGAEYRDWFYSFVSHSTGTSIRRTTYNVAILDPYQNRIAYLRDFSSIDQAAHAAREWIDHRLSLLGLNMPADLGTIPALPAAETPAQKNPTQEK